MLAWTARLLGWTRSHTHHHHTKDEASFSLWFFFSPAVAMPEPMVCGVAVQRGHFQCQDFQSSCPVELSVQLVRHLPQAWEGEELEHSSFTPVVLSSTGGLQPAATATYKRLASLLVTKWNQPYSTTMSWLRCRLSFSLLRSSIQACCWFRCEGYFWHHLLNCVHYSQCHSN